MHTTAPELLAAARAEAESMPLDQIDPASLSYFADGVELP